MKKVIHYFNILTSTNDWAKQHFSSFEEDALTIVWADQQTRGRGQYGRYWFSPAKLNLYTSFCFFLNEKQMHIDPLSLTTLLALCMTDLLKKKKLSCRIKWPNDVLVKEKKIAGILCETLSFGEKTGVILGIGCNILMPSSLLFAIDQPATSLLEEARKKYAIAAILDELAEILERKLKSASPLNWERQ